MGRSSIRTQKALLHFFTSASSFKYYSELSLPSLLSLESNCSSTIKPCLCPRKMTLIKYRVSSPTRFSKTPFVGLVVKPIIYVMVGNMHELSNRVDYIERTKHLELVIPHTVNYRVVACIKTS